MDSTWTEHRTTCEAGYLLLADSAAAITKIPEIVMSEGKGGMSSHILAWGPFGCGEGSAVQGFGIGGPLETRIDKKGRKAGCVSGTGTASDSVGTGEHASQIRG